VREPEHELGRGLSRGVEDVLVRLEHVLERHCQAAVEVDAQELWAVFEV